MKTTFCELFAGAGGMSLGLIAAGLSPTGAWDNWDVANDNYRRNVSSKIWRADLRDPGGVIEWLKQNRPFMLAGGAPCQDFSSAGSREEGSNASLTVVFAEIVAAVRPEMSFSEQVVAALGSEAFRKYVRVLKDAGYGLSVVKVDASRYGVPQRRRRLIIVARLGERDGFLDDAIISAASPRSMTLRDRFGAGAAGEIAPEDKDLVETGYFYTRPQFDGQGVRSIDEPMRTVTRTSWERPTSRYLSKPHPQDPVPATQAAVLSSRQLSAIQGFPPEYDWQASAKRNIYQMIANAVPPPLAKAVGEIIMARDRGENIPEAGHRFVQWLRRQGETAASAGRIRSHANRARKILRGRLLANVTSEIAMLESNEEFRVMRPWKQSHLRKAVKLYAAFHDHEAARPDRTGAILKAAALQRPGVAVSATARSKQARHVQ